MAPDARPKSRRTARKKMSYRELTSDEELSDIPRRNRVPVRSSKRVERQGYQEDASENEDSSSDDDLSDVHPRGQTPIRSKRRTERKSYNEDTSSSDDFDSFSDTHSHIPAPRSTAKSSPRKRPTSTRPTGSTRDSATPKKQRINVGSNSVKPRLRPEIHPFLRPGQKIPPWQDLEYEILLQIFQYASYPLYENVSHPRQSIQWLLDTSSMSKSFRAAAVAALLYSPPIFPATRAHRLLYLLQKDQDTLSTNYKTKIKRLDVEARHLLLKKSGIVLADLVKHTPLLQVLHIYHNHDLVGPAMWAQPAAAKQKWSYPRSLFQALDDASITLRQFTWNGRFPESKQVLEGMNMIHLLPCLNNLQSLSLVNLDLPEKTSEEDKQHYEDILATALSLLPQLKELAFEKCNVFNDTLLPKLPHGLERLTISSCGSFTSKGLHTFLEVHGNELKQLSLLSNQAMDLGFIPDLAELCPRLQELHVDLTYVDPSSYHDVDPHYDELLPNGQPTWPKDLRVIDFANLRNLEASEADDFFQSLVNASADLRNLRRLSIKALLKIGWRDRANLRSKWIIKFDKIFLRKTLPPRPVVTIPWKPKPQAKHAPGVELVRDAAAATNIGRASGPAQATTTDVATDRSESDVEPSKPINSRKSTRIAQKEQENMAEASAADEDHDTDEINSQNASDDDDDSEENVQGMCDSVIFRIDDQRPAESQFNEGDFLDSEVSGDEDWTGRSPPPNAMKRKRGRKWRVG